jgi:hypothetical protein
MAAYRLCPALAFVVLLPLSSPAAERMTDEQVKKLVEDIDAGYDAWKRGLEKENLDDAVIKTAERTIQVKVFLKDFEKAIDLVKDRYAPGSAAATEVLALLRLSSDVELRNRRQGLAPSSEWPALGAKLGALAGAYGLAWPIESMNVQPARLNDGELAARIQKMEASTKRLQSETEKAAKANKSIDKTTRESLKKSIQDLERTAKDVRERIQGDRPAEVEATKLLSQTGGIKKTLAGLSLPTAGETWQGVDSGAQAVARSFDLPNP